jgi:hypothetical protein
MRGFSSFAAGLAAAAGTLVLAAAAHAAPPNDARGAAQPLTPPQRVAGTTVGATIDANEPSSGCASTADATVWYALDAAAARTVLLDLSAAGEMDAAVDVYRRVRSQLTPVDCRTTGGDGRARLDFDQPAGTTYLVRIAPLRNSVEDVFTLQARIVQPPASPPGPRLPRGGARGRLDRATNPDDAWSKRLVEGRSYRVNLVTPSGAPCVTGALFAPGTRSFDAAPARRLPCGGYRLFTPRAGESGRWSVHLVAPRGASGSTRYRLHVTPAGRDDTLPGRFIRNDARVRGALHGAHSDVVDLYRFDVTFPSTLELGLRTSRNFDLQLLGERGRRVACDCGRRGAKQLSLRLRPGRYFAAVRARDGAGGRYRLSRLSKTITATRVEINGRRHAAAAPGARVTIGVLVGPPVTGPVTIDVERRDPLFGWQFLRRIRTRTVAGRALVSYAPPTIGRYRASARYEGTRASAASESGFARLSVAAPLTQ